KNNNNINNNKDIMSPDFVLMRLVSAAEYDRLHETDDLRPGGGGDQHHLPSAEENQVLQWHPSGSVLCHRHRSLTDRLAKWPPDLLDQALRLLEPRKNEDPVLALARRLGQLGEGREGGGGGEIQVPRCSCHSVLASGTGGEDPSETSDALLVLEGLGSEEVHRLAEEAGVCTDQGCRPLPSCPPTSPCLYPPVCPQALQVSPDPPDPQRHHQSRSQPQSRAATPKLGVASGGAGVGREGEKTPRGKSRKGGSLKVRLSKLFRTKSSSGGSGGLLDKRPSLASSTSSGGSLLDVWGSTEQDSSETVSLVDVDISRRGVNSLHPPTPPPPPRRSLSLLDTFLRGLPRPVPLRPDGQLHPPRLVPRCPLSRPDAGSFATSLRELEKCGWYWGPMNWEDAEMKLKGKPDGSFLVRDSSDPRYILSLSFRSQGVTHHTRMEHYRGTFSLWCHPKFEDRCHSVVEFIERAIMHSKNGKFLYFLRSRVPGLPPTPVQLLYPVSRFSSVKSLQHLCRFCIRQLVRIDHIQELPLPTPLISYLRKFYYYDPEEEINPSLKERGPEPSSQPRVQSQT
uniref:Suppressor of cytokine signaling 7 n=1 Tax=Dicentrarchus labrax TaxID=13489 RepID=A0A8P4KDX5_DICLA